MRRTLLLILVLLTTIALPALTGCLPQETAKSGRPQVGDMPAPLGMGGDQRSSALELGIYVVTSEDKTFFDIAEKVYGNGDLWRPIAEANPEVHQARLRPGQQLIIPDSPEQDNPAD